MLSLRLRIRGRVQGVWFRGSTREQALGLGLVGWVRNRDDGSVEALALGDEQALRALQRWCCEGPPLAQVEAIDAQWGEAEDGPFVGFEVR